MAPARHTRQRSQQEQHGSQDQDGEHHHDVRSDKGGTSEHGMDSDDEVRATNGSQAQQRSSQRRARSQQNDSHAGAETSAASTVRGSENDNTTSRSRSAEDGYAEGDPDHVKIMLATDNHVGYMEKDPIRGRDSINTFREILQLAAKHDVDFVLLVGDLFHENRPSRTSMHQVMGALREFTLGDKPVSVELMSDPNVGQLEGYHFPAINYEDSNLNIAIPVFSIHGNHDDPQGVGSEGALSAVDLLSVTGLVNYFGKIELPSEDSLAKQKATQAPASGGLTDVGIRIRPVLLQKGSTKVALYGMGNVKDERMHFELRNNRVRMYRPSEHVEDWFNILAIHQNRVGHDPKAVVPETMFDDSIHLVVWGHEHEQRLKPEPVIGKRYHISQPGSSVATSLMPGEAADKKVGIIHVRGRDFHIEPLDLKTVRPFVEEMVDLDDILKDENVALEEKPKLNKIFVRRVNALIEHAREKQEERFGHLPPEERPEKMLPLIRLRVVYSRMEPGTFVRFGQNFVDKVANPKDILHFSKKKAPPKKRNAAERGEFNDPQAGMVASEKMEKTRMSDLTKTYLRAQTLQLLDPMDLDRSVTLFVDKDDNSAIPTIVRKGLKQMRDGLVQSGSDETRMNAELERIREMRARREEEDGDGAGVSAASAALSDEDDEFLNLGMDDAGPSRRTQASTTTRGRGAGSKTPQDMSPPSRTARGKATQPSPSQRTLVFRGGSMSDDGADSDVAISQPPTRAASSSRQPAKKAAPSKPTSKTKTTAAPTARRTGGRAAAQRASSRFVESQAISDDDDDDFEMSM